MKIDTEIVIRKYKDAIFALSYCICKDDVMAEDIVQDTFVKYHFCDKEFESEEHIRSWLTRVAINLSKNQLLCFWKRNRISVEDYAQTLAFETNESYQLFTEVMALPQKYRTTLHLYYYEGYSVKEIANILEISESNVKVRLMRGRDAVKLLIKED